MRNEGAAEYLKCLYRRDTKGKSYSSNETTIPTPTSINGVTVSIKYMLLRC